MKKIVVAALVALLVVGSAVASTSQTSSRNETTLKKTIVGAGKKDLSPGPGQKAVNRTLRWVASAPVGTPIAGFKQVSDIHAIDEESPGRFEFFDECKTAGLVDAFRPQDSMSTQVGESMLRRLARITTGPVTSVPLDFVMSTGDMLDSNQFNELRWVIDLLDGETITPNSGAETYDGYTKAMGKQVMTDEVLELAQQSFDSTGTVVPWYLALGNHDGLIRGQVAPTPEYSNLITGARKPFIPIKDHSYCPEEDRFGGSGTAAALAALFERGEEIPADEDRHLMNHPEIVAEFFNTAGQPVGHGLENAPEDPVNGSIAGYYTFNIAPNILGISMDSVNYAGGSNGSIPDPQFQWIEEQLKANSTSYIDSNGVPVENPNGTEKLIVLFSHHTSKSMNNPGGIEAAEPYHCFLTGQVEGCEAEGLRDLFFRYPNVIAWVDGHEHKNRVRPYVHDDADPATGFWELVTASHIDWPQQSRLIEIAFAPGADGDTVIIYGTIVDHTAAPDANKGSQDTVEYLASVSRVEAYYDACVRKNQANCKNLGKPKDRNVKLLQKAPFDLGS